MKKLTLLLLALLYVTLTYAYTERDLLQKQADINRLKEILVLDRQWVTYPDYNDRASWDRFLGTFKDEYIRRGEKRLNYQWQVVKATDYLAFERTGNRQIMEKPFGANNGAIADLLMAELAEGKGRFVDQLINGVFNACEMTSWALAAHIIVQPSHRALPAYDYPVIDLTSGDLGGLLAWTYHFMRPSFDKVDPEISRRLRHELQTRILDPYMNNDSFWWMGRNYNGRMLNNWNPWCNSNALMCFMLLEDNRDTLAKAVHLTMESVDKFLNYIKADGACEEGPSYWGHAAGKTLDYLELLSDITGDKVNIFNEPMIKNMGEYISRSYIGNGWVVNFADASARGEGNSYLIYRFGKAVNSEEMMHFAAYLLNGRKPYATMGNDAFRSLQSLLCCNDLAKATPKHEMPDVTWYPETEFCYMKNKHGMFVAAKGGFNNESHNHNDAGTFSLYLNTIPVLIDAGVGTYTKQTFGKDRYKIWTMQSDYHNLPMINGISQKFGQDYKATNTVCNEKNRFFSTDIAAAYPAEAKVKSWVRSYKLDDRKLVVADNYTLNEVLAPNQVNFLTWGNVTFPSPGKVRIEVRGQKVELDYPAQFKAELETVKLDDPRLSNVWGKEIYRITLKAEEKKMTGNYKFVIQQVK